MSQQGWHRLSRLAAADDDVAGLVLTGGRGKGLATALSDWDVLLVVADRAVDRWRALECPDLDLTVLGESEFAGYAEPGTAFAWRAYDFAHLSPVIDRRGFGERLSLKGTLHDGRAVAAEHLDAMLNSLYRATKNRRDGDEVAALLDLAEMTGYYLTTLFAIEGRLRPYNKLLRWDLDRAPTTKVDLTVDVLLRLLTRTLHGDVEAAWLLARQLADAGGRAGLTDVLDGWSAHLVAVRPSWPSPA